MGVVMARVAVIGDVGGHADQLRKVLRELGAESEQLPSDLIVIQVGDLVDRGPDSIGVLDTVAPRMGDVDVVRQQAERRWKVSYSATDATSGVAGYRVKYRIGSGPWRTLKKLTTSTHAYLELPRRYTVTFSVRAVDRAGNWSDDRRARTP